MKMAVRMRHLIALCVFALGCSDIALAQESPQVVLSRPSDPGLADRGIIVFSISNPTDKPVAIVSFETPFATDDDHLANVEFQVSDSKNEELAYRGRNVYFGPPDSSSFLTLGPHETLKKNVDVAKEYGITDGGAYTVTYVKNLRILRSSGVQRLNAVRPGDDIPLESSRSNTLTIWINDALIKAQGAVARQHAAEEGVAALTCSGSQSSTLSSDVSASAAQTLSALTHLGASYSYDYDANNIPIHGHVSDPRYIYWFGTYDSSILLTDPSSVNSDNAQVDQVMAATYYRLANGPMSFDCGCSASYPPATRAWAETGSPYLVHICDSYWTDPATGGSPAPSRVATLVHEASHFNDQFATGTADNYYTSPEAHSAAISARHTAVRTAVNYEFYIMNASHP